MPRKLTVEEIDELLTERGFERSGYYTGNMHSPTPLRCLTCKYEWNATISHIKKGSGCPSCYGNARITVAQVDELLAERGFKRAGDYVGATRNLTPLRCLTCEYEWKSTISHIKEGTGCPSCAGKARVTVEQVDELLSEKDFERAGDYVGTTQKPTPLRCLTCVHEWKATINSIKSGSGCPSCAGKARVTVEQIDELLAEKGFERAGDYVGSVSKPTPLRCLTCENEWGAKINNIKSGYGCPSCARNPWLRQGIYHLRHPDKDYEYVGISWRPDHRLEQHQLDEGPRGELARLLDEPYELTFGEVYDLLDVAWEEGTLPEYVLNWFEQNPHGKLPHGRLWFVDWDNLSEREKNEPARIPKFAAEWVEKEMIRLLSVHHETGCPFQMAGKVNLVNIALNRMR